jgi:homoserine O-acetyltransferase/O-succinyltransferase
VTRENLMPTPIVRTATVQLFGQTRPFPLDLGGRLMEVTAAYETYGNLAPDGSNAILLCHALTGNAHAGGFSSDDPKSAGWWEPMIGPGRGFDTDRYFVICSNILGSCYGTTGPSSPNPATGSPYGMTFPQMSVRDMVRVQRALLDHLEVKRLVTVCGGSLGGMQALEWACMYPEIVGSIIPIGTAARHSPWCIGLNDIGRQAIMNDPGWHGGSYHSSGQPERGLSLARQIAMISYRSDLSFLRRFGREQRERDGVFQVESYLRYQGKKLVQRFDANSYLYITRAMDLHDVGRDRGTTAEVLGRLRLPVMCIGISSDVLYPVHEQRAIAAGIPAAIYREIVSDDGHDAFLIEYGQMTEYIREFLE